MLLLTERLEAGEGGSAVLDLAKNIQAEEKSFIDSFRTLGHSAKACVQAMEYAANFIVRNQVGTIRLPYTSDSQFFVDVLERIQEQQTFRCTVQLIVAAGVDTRTVDSELYERFTHVENITCELAQEVHTVRAITLADLAPTATDEAPAAAAAAASHHAS